MCNGCLSKRIEYITESIELLKPKIDNQECPGCRSFSIFCMYQLNSLKLISLTKMKKYYTAGPRLEKLKLLEESLTENVKESLMSVSGEVFDNKEDLCEGDYLNKMEWLKCLNNMLEGIVDAEHR